MGADEDAGTWQDGEANLHRSKSRNSVEGNLQILGLRQTVIVIFKVNKPYLEAREVQVPGGSISGVM